MCFRRRVEGCSAREATMVARTRPTAKNRSAVAQMYRSPTSSSRIFCTMKVATCKHQRSQVRNGRAGKFRPAPGRDRVAIITEMGRAQRSASKSIDGKEGAQRTVFDSSLPISMVRRHRGMISVERRKLMTSVSSTCTNEGFRRWSRFFPQNAEETRRDGKPIQKKKKNPRSSSTSELLKAPHPPGSAEAAALFYPGEERKHREGGSRDGFGCPTFTSAPMTPRLVSLRYSNGLVLLVVFRNGYRYSGM